ncbi:MULTISPECIES: 4-hydroxy-3-methylbut-2-enyl diphosphate reductase [Cycloclasticus]|jgi:4-hydroxy-3-methylbut-2-enyl diphosphate reductase|uniref:4-hydroxy-3-methylbut-2-enyl diphosphate reductase n=1 Tax=Cycloclasticus pugetii TaxID=34068 RepID=A0AB33Z4K4_9GAMM|nr:MULTISPECIES: 4-hydroxy-3-methylbut-2-enyl diphosphate reductase [Cycloclasticus]ATI03967.1 4-hydroxy-3-methylbut-2-enyl diphosphate reductase [Cycloclasticus sp. PY97N]EPD14406.1 4-hydroxy-3-methylbut-2-enyl diphosphate reductase [Cycloclasticus pugetii]
MQIFLANPRGFCAGVDRAIEIVERALELLGSPIYVRHEVVHNRFVVENLKKRGAIFVEELNEVPDDSTVIFSAHGVSKAVEDEAKRRQLNVFDATCPLVTKVHMEVVSNAKKGRCVILIGHKGHPEVEGTMGRYEQQNPDVRIILVESPEDVESLEIPANTGLSYVTQTTLSMDDTSSIIDALRDKFPHITGPKKSDICYATQNRQDAVKELAEKSDLVLVVGSPNSSNSNRLREIAEKLGKPAYLIDGSEDIDKRWLEGVHSIGVTAGASAPEELVQRVIDQLKCWGGETALETPGIQEKVTFSLPKALQK